MASSTLPTAAQATTPAPAPAPEPAPAPAQPSKPSRTLFGIPLSTITPHLTPSNIIAAVLLLVIIVSGALLFMALVGMLRFSTVAAKESWIEINSQILNAIFTFNALVVQPQRLVLCWVTGWYVWYRRRGDWVHVRMYAARIGASGCGVRVYGDGAKDGNNGGTNNNNNNSNGGNGGGGGRARSASERPVVDEVGTLDSSASTPVGGSSSGIYPPQTSQPPQPPQSSTSQPPQSSLPPIVPLWKWVCILSLLMGQCLFQYPIAAAMWAWAGNPSSRPPWIVGTFLPLSFLSGAAGGIWPLLIAWRARKAKTVAVEETGSAGSVGGGGGGSTSSG